MKYFKVVLEFKIIPENLKVSINLGACVFFLEKLMVDGPHPPLIKRKKGPWGGVSIYV